MFTFWKVFISVWTSDTKNRTQLIAPIHWAVVCKHDIELQRSFANVFDCFVKICAPGEITGNTLKNTAIQVNKQVVLAVISPQLIRCETISPFRGSWKVTKLLHETKAKVVLAELEKWK